MNTEGPKTPEYVEVKSVNATLNFTRRRTILRNRINVELIYPDETGGPILNALAVDLRGLDLPEEARAFADFWTTGLDREVADLGSVSDGTVGVAKPLDLLSLGRTSCKMIVNVVDSEGQILASANKIPFSPPDLKDPGEGDGLSWIKNIDTVNLVAWGTTSDLGPDRLLDIEYPEGGAAPQAVIRISEHCRKGYDRTQQKPEHAFRKIILEFALVRMIDRVVEEAQEGSFDPGQPLDINSRWAARMHDWLSDGGAGSLKEVDMEDEIDISEWKRRAFQRWSSGKATPFDANSMFGGGY